MARPKSLAGLALWLAATAAIVLPIGLFLFAWSGLYSVAASEGHLALTRAILTFGLHSSVRTHSIGIAAPELDSPDLVTLGAGHFAGGCALCHGAPGVPRNPISRSMLPPPPDLSETIDEWETDELFWIVKHGIKYTGMPGWTAQARDDEVWAVVAFLLRLPTLSAADYQALANFPAAAGATVQPRGWSEFSETLTLCARCHGDENSAPVSGLAPILSGQSPLYLASALRDYARGARLSGIMQPVAAELDDAAINELAAIYAAFEQRQAITAAAPAPPEQIERGERLALEGAPDDDVPACLACHASPETALFPSLVGQHAPYIVTQLDLWKRGVRGLTASSAIMEVIAERLSERQLHDVAAYFDSLAPERGGQPVEPESDPTEDAGP